MRHLRPVISLIWVLAILMLPALNANAQNGASVTTNNSTNASANSRATNAQVKADAQAKADAAKNAASQAKAGANATSQTDVKLDKPSWQVVLDSLFGSPDNGLLDGQKAFQFRAENVSLTADQSAAFFSSSSTSSQDLAALIEAAQALHGQVRMDGTIDGKPFELKLAGRELKLEGLTLTVAQRDALVAELRGISALHEAKIDALVDGRASRIQIAGGRDRIELLGRDRDRSERGDGNRIEIGSKADVVNKVEIARPEKMDTRVETSGRVGGAIEKPELPRIGK